MNSRMLSPGICVSEPCHDEEFLTHMRETFDIWVMEANRSYGCLLYVDALGCIRTNQMKIDDDPFLGLTDIEDNTLGDVHGII